MSGGSTKQKTLAVFEVTIFLAVLMAIARLARPSGPTWLRHLSITLLWTIPPLAYVILAGPVGLSGRRVASSSGPRRATGAGGRTQRSRRRRTAAA